MSLPWQDKVCGMVRDALSAASGLSGVVGSVYVGELAQQPTPRYPCITLRIVTGEPAIIDSARGQIRIWVWSNTSATEAATLWARVEATLFNALLSKTGARTVFRSDENMVDMFESSTHMYACVGSFSFTMIHNNKAL